MLVTGCSKSSEDKPAPAPDTILGAWGYVPVSTASTEKGIYVKLDTSQFLSVSYYATISGNSILMYFRKYEGTYTMTGNRLDVTYSYETCNPVGHESFNLNLKNGQLVVGNIDNSVIFNMQRVPGSQVANLTFTAIEDKGCNKFVKNESKKDRMPANTEKKTPFDLFLRAK